MINITTSPRVDQLSLNKAFGNLASIVPYRYTCCLRVSIVYFWSHLSVNQASGGDSAIIMGKYQQKNWIAVIVPKKRSKSMPHLNAPCHYFINPIWRQTKCHISNVSVSTVDSWGWNFKCLSQVKQNWLFRRIFRRCHFAIAVANFLWKSVKIHKSLNGAWKLVE